MTATHGRVETTAGRADGIRNHLQWIDLARVLAISAVVVIHVVAPVVATRTTDFGTPTWWAANTVNSGLRWCVPVFIMLSGALLLDPDRPSAIRSFYARRAARIGVPLVVWTVFYLLYDGLWWSGLSAEQATEQVLTGSPFLHLYFLFVIAGLYVLTPFLRVFTCHATRRMQWAFALVMTALGAVDQVLVMLGGAGQPNAVTRFLPFIGFYVAGWLLRDMRLDRRLVTTATLAYLGSWAVTALGTGAVTDAVGWNRTAAYLYNFLSPPVAVMSLGAFVLLRALGSRWRAVTTEPGARRVRALSDVSFGVFLVHAALLFPLRGAVGIPDGLAGSLAVSALLTAAVLVASAAVTALLRRTPYLRATV